MPTAKIEKKPVNKPTAKKGKPRPITKKTIEKPGGRPSEFDQAAPKIIAYIRKGNNYECASGCARVSYNTFNRWIRQGREDETNGLLESKFYKFCCDVDQAERECEEEVVGYWKQEMPGNWQACKEYLARRHHEKWGSKEKVDIVSNGETIVKPIFLPMKKYDEEE